MQKRKDARRKDASKNISVLTLGQRKLQGGFLLTLEVALTVLAVLMLRNPFRHFWQCPLGFTCLDFTCLDFRLILLWKTFKALSHRKRSCYGWSFTELKSWHELGQVCLYELQISMLLGKIIKLKQLVLGFVLV